MLAGVDVSKYQGSIDWDAFAPQLDFVFIRATNSVASVDPEYARNRAEAANNGLIRGYYHFAIPSEDALTQARHFCATLGELGPGELDPVLDLEWTQHQKNEGHRWTADDTEELKRWTHAFVKEVKARYPDRSVIIYTRYFFWKDHLGGCNDFVDCPLWIAHYTHGDDSLASRPPSSLKEWEAWANQKPLPAWGPWPKWSFWQFTAKAVLPGVTVNTVDANLFDGTKDELRALARLTVTPPTTEKPTATAEALCRLMLSQSGDPYIFGYEVRLTDPNPPAFDCAEIIEWACYQLGITPKMPDGSWIQARHVKNANLLIPVETAIRTRGALLFRFSGDPFTGGRPDGAHVAVSLGDGSTIEARGKQYGVGVFPAKDRGWTHAGLVPGIDYSAVPESGSIQKGSKGSEVRAWQEQLLAWRPDILPRYGADGDFGNETDKATKVFQQEMGLSPTGIVDFETREAMQRALTPQETRPCAALQRRFAASRRAPTQRALGIAAAAPRAMEAPRGLEIQLGSEKIVATADTSVEFSIRGLRVRVSVSAEDEAALEMPISGIGAPKAKGAKAAPPRARATAGEFDGMGLSALPTRASDALTGSEFYEEVRDLGLAEREERFLEEILSGNVPSFLREFHRLTVEAPGLSQRGVVYVSPDYLAVGSDEDFLRLPVTGVTAQRIADACCCILPTKKLVNEIYAHSTREVALTRSHDRTTIGTFFEHNQAIEKEHKGAPGELRAGHKKEIVVTKRLLHYPKRLAIHGFFKANGEPWQDLNTSLKSKLPHDDTYVDYSHGIRLVGAVMALGTEKPCVYDVLLDPARAALLSEEGIISAPHYEVRPLA